MIKKTVLVITCAVFLYFCFNEFKNKNYRILD